MFVCVDVLFLSICLADWIKIALPHQRLGILSTTIVIFLLRHFAILPFRHLADRDISQFQVACPAAAGSHSFLSDKVRRFREVFYLWQSESDCQVKRCNKLIRKSIVFRSADWGGFVIGLQVKYLLLTKPDIASSVFCFRFLSSSGNLLLLPFYHESGFSCKTDRQTMAFTNFFWSKASEILLNTVSRRSKDPNQE